MLKMHCRFHYVVKMRNVCFRRYSACPPVEMANNLFKDDAQPHPYLSAKYKGFVTKFEIYPYKITRSIKQWTCFSIADIQMNRTYAYYTVKDRMPVIVTRVIDSLCRNKAKLEGIYGEVIGK